VSDKDTPRFLSAYPTPSSSLVKKSSAGIIRIVVPLLPSALMPSYSLALLLSCPPASPCPHALMPSCPPALLPHAQKHRADSA
jgi:hypothetical protein